MSGMEALEAKGRLERNLPLGPLTTYRFGGPARLVVTVDGADDARLLAEVLATEPAPVLCLGRGSNVLVSDAGFDGVVVRLGPSLNAWSLQDGLARTGGALPLPRLARESARLGRGGLEWMTGVPGSVGGAVRMNAGCHGTDTAEWLETAVVADLDTGAVSSRTAGELEMGYRTTALGSRDLVLSAVFRTVDRPVEEAEAQIREITRWRRENQPGGAANAGSVFKNPPGDSAGRIIDSLGLKGLRIGGASVSERHANFFVAEADASAQDVHGLIVEVRRRVAEATGIVLEPEVRLVGEFG